MPSTSPNLDQLLTEIGQAGQRIDHMGASEGSAGNISVCLRTAVDVGDRFPCEEEMELPFPVPALAGMAFLVTGSGCRLRDILDAPTANLGCLIVDQGGQTGRLFSAPDRLFPRLTSEFNSHLAVHHTHMVESALPLHAIVHAQPAYITYLSHIERYQDETYFNQHLLRWEPETILQFPLGMGMLKFQVPGSMEMTRVTEASLLRHTITVWARHGVVARSDRSVMHACDRVEYAEAAARFEYLNLSAGEPSSGMSVAEIRAVCEAANLHQEIF